MGERQIIWREKASSREAPEFHARQNGSSLTEVGKSSFFNLNFLDSERAFLSAALIQKVDVPGASKFKNWSKQIKFGIGGGRRQP